MSLEGLMEIQNPRMEQRCEQEAEGRRNLPQNSRCSTPGETGKRLLMLWLLSDGFEAVLPLFHPGLYLLIAIALSFAATRR